MRTQKTKYFFLSKFYRFAIFSHFLAFAIFKSSIFFVLAEALSSTPKSIKIDELIDYCLEDPAEIHISKFKIESAETQLGLARSKFIPNLSLGANYQEVDRSTSNANSTSLSGLSASQSGWTTKSTARWNLFNGFQDLKLLDQRKMELKKADVDLEATQFNKKLAALELVYRIATLQTDLENLQGKILVDQEREKEIKRRVAARASRSSDLLTVSATRMAAVSDQQLTELNLKDAWLQLEKIAGRKISVREVKILRRNLSPLKLDLAKAIHPQVAANQFEVEAAEIAYSGKRGSYLPTIDLSANYYFQRPSLYQTSRWDLGLSLQLDLPFDGQKQAMIRQAVTELNSKKVLLQQAQHEHLLKVQTLLESYNSELERLKTLDQVVETYEQLVRSLKRDYEAGNLTLTEYLNSAANSWQQRINRDRLFLKQMNRLSEISMYYPEAGQMLGGQD